MAKVDPFADRRPARAVHTLTFTDSDRPSEPVVLSLRKPDSVDWGKIADLTTNMTEKYVTGDELEGTPAQPFPGHFAEPLEMSKGLCSQVAMVCVIQRPEDKAERYTFEELVGVSVNFPGAWAQISRAVRNIIAYGTPEKPPEEDTTRKNGAGAEGTKDYSLSPSTV